MVWRLIQAERQRGRAYQPRFQQQDVLLSWVGGLLAIAALGQISSWSHYPLVVAPFGASTVLLFGYPASPLAQPRNIVLGNMIAALVSVGCVATPVQVFGGWGFYTGAWASLRRRALNMDVLIALGTSVAYFYSVVVVFAPQWLPVGIDERGVYFEVSAVVIAFVLMGKYMEEIIKQRSSAAVRRLLDLQPASATVIREGQEMTVPAEAVVQGDVLLVRPGEKVPADGVVLEGQSSVDEALITGESLPVNKQSGSELIGGTLNGRGLLRFTATRVGADTAPVQRLADRVTAWFVPAVVGVAVLVISCPCALGIATPAALMVGVGKGAELGILIRSGEVLERVEQLTTVVFDKTGTLTRGKPALTQVVPMAGTSREQLLQWAASLEHGSEHPLAAALIEAAAATGLALLPTSVFQAQVGEGVQAQLDGQSFWLGNRALAARFVPQLGETVQAKLQRLESAGNTVMLLGQDANVLGLLAVADTVRPEAREVVGRLQRRRIRVVMLSGDNRSTADAIATQVGITEVIAEVRPPDKAATIKALQQAGPWGGSQSSSGPAVLASPHPQDPERQITGLRFEPNDRQSPVQPAPLACSDGMKTGIPTALPSCLPTRAAPRGKEHSEGGLMATCSLPDPKGAVMASDVLRELKQLVRRDPQFAVALRSTDTTEQAAELVRRHGLKLTPEALWRHRGMLVEGGSPTWRG